MAAMDDVKPVKIINQRNEKNHSEQCSTEPWTIYLCITHACFPQW